jgi:hypothetical protein
MNLDSGAGMALIGAITLACVGLVVAWISGTRAAPLLGLRPGSIWWFSPEGGRTQGLVVAYLAGIVAIGALAYLTLNALWPSATTLAWTACWVSASVSFASSIARFGRLIVAAASGGRVSWDDLDYDEDDLVEPDPAFDDLDLRTARQAASVGQWRPAADLLAITANEDVRFDRICVLASLSLRHRRWLDAWLRERPTDRDALAVQTQLAVERAWEIRGGTWEAQNVDHFFAALDEAEGLARHAIALHPEDPAPRVCLITLARGQQVDDVEFTSRVEALRAICPHHRAGHEQALQYIAPKWFGSTTQMFEFARQAGDGAGPGSPLNLLVVIAHLEEWLIQCHDDPRTANAYWASEDVRNDLLAAQRSWQDLPEGHAPASPAWGHNLLAFAFWRAQLPREAADHLAATRTYLAEWPWEYLTDPSQAHASAQGWLRKSS